jgi:hypothetical protein
MPKVISVHEYILKEGVNDQEFEQAIQTAKARGLLRLPGLIEYYFTKGIRGGRTGKYAAIWVYESKEAWQKLWGPVGHPRAKQNYPKNWKIWENEILKPFLTEDPDKINFNTYEEL